jgi:hypothetical protein
MMGSCGRPIIGHRVVQGALMPLKIACVMRRLALLRMPDLVVGYHQVSRTRVRGGRGCPFFADRAISRDYCAWGSGYPFDLTACALVTRLSPCFIPWPRGATFAWACSLLPTFLHDHPPAASLMSTPEPPPAAAHHPVLCP